MAEAARTVKHYVSDCLQERHPYDAKKAFAGRPARDKGLVYSGFMPHTVDDWILSLSDTEVLDAQRVRTVRLLIAHSASQEAKITLLRKNIVEKVVAALITTPSADFECQVFSLLRSLSVISQGCYSVIQGGGLEAVVRSIQDRADLDERAHARETAAMVLFQISFNTAGLRWLLETDVPDGFELIDPPASASTCVFSKEDVVDALVLILQNDAQASSKILLYATMCLAQLTSLTEGIFVAMKREAVSAVSKLLHGYATNTTTLDTDTGAQVATFLLTVVWNVCLDQAGADLIDTLGTPDDIFLLVAALYKSITPPNYPLLRALTGALSAVYKLLSVKMRSCESLDGDFSRIHVIFNFIRSLNFTVERCEKLEQELHSDVVAISKNLVLSTHFAMEVKAVRDFTHQYLQEMQEIDAFYFRRQLFYSTKWEEEFDATVKTSY
ncbi:hypothetical protein ERJ75_001610600 [Trypanosoma vivax]|uniref:Uncharacterized protein n=1 Tax=Trypanosoma vivax (strain Y486) TaxID=1055687 RepID=G0TSY1_TRYVY|nr:hypothetical protein TRVL_01546 [Trypanosoma vivax]KAH8605355.1 hypothetical protein ERJ75_001610600 [Trypanosoma vivax]CCC47061.1 conserved hypothetical protein [Trypanosoma vivax Y486]